MLKGWGWPSLAKKAHYFIDGTSICGRWMYMGTINDTETSGPDDCAECKRRWTKMKEKAKKVPK